MNVKVIIIIACSIGLLILIYFHFKILKDVSEVNTDNMEKLFSELKKDIGNTMKISIDKYVEKLKNISSDNLNQLKKISLLHRQTVTKMSNHFTETMDSERHSDINYLSDVMVHNTQNTTANKPKEYYMSEDTDTESKLKKNTSSNNINITETTKTSNTHNGLVYLLKNNSINSPILPVTSIKNNNSKSDCQKVEIVNISDQVLEPNCQSSGNSETINPCSPSNNDTSIDNKSVNPLRKSDIVMLNNVGNVLDKIKSLFSEKAQTENETLGCFDNTSQSSISKRNCDAHASGQAPPSKLDASVTEDQHLFPVPRIKGTSTRSSFDNKTMCELTDLSIDPMRLKTSPCSSFGNSKPNDYSPIILNVDNINKEQDNSINISEIDNKVISVENINKASSIHNITESSDNNSLKCKNTTNTNGLNKDNKKIILKDINEYTMKDLRDVATQLSIKISIINNENGKKKSRLYKKDELYNMISDRLK